MSLPLPLQVEYLDTLAQAMATPSGFDPEGFRTAAEALTQAQGMPATIEQRDAAIRTVIQRHAPASTTSPRMSLAELTWDRPRSKADYDHECEALNAAWYAERAKGGCAKIEDAAFVLHEGALAGFFMVAPILGGLGWWGWSEMTGVILAEVGFLATLVFWGGKYRKARRASLKMAELMPRIHALKAHQPTLEQLNLWQSVPDVAHHVRACMASEVGLLVGDVEHLDKVCASASVAREKAELAQRTSQFLNGDLA